ncbi:MAG: response regulator transcription factor [Clostridia bacterium]|nr:response regulator transcription factor [Clostridia bacterium]
MAGENILIIDDDEDIITFLKIYLENEQFNIFTASNYQDALSIVKKHHIDLILLDVLLPNIDGFEICLNLRKITTSPIIFLSCKNEELDKVVGLSVGGDDYITKPFLPGELMARIKSNIRRSRDYSIKNEARYMISLQNITINLLTKKVFINGQLVNLLPKEFSILILFVKNPERIFSKEEIFELIWKDQILETDINTIMVHISNLRKKIKTPNHDFPQIITIKGMGYKLILEET